MFLDMHTAFSVPETPTTPSLVTPVTAEELSGARAQIDAKIQTTIGLWEQRTRHLPDFERNWCMGYVRNETQQLIKQLDCLMSIGSPHERLHEVTNDSLKQLETSMSLFLQDKQTAIREREVTRQALHTINHNIETLSLPPPQLASSTQPTVPFWQKVTVPLLKVQTTQVAFAASAVRTLDQSVNFVVGSAATGIVKGTQAVCGSHPLLQQGCDKVAEEYEQLMETAHNLTEEYWEGSDAQQGLQAFSTTCDTQYQKGSQAFSRSLSEQGLSPTEITEYEQNLQTIGKGVLCYGSLGGAALIGKAVKAHKATTVATVASNATNLTGQSTKLVKAVEVVEATQVVETTRATQAAAKHTLLDLSPNAKRVLAYGVRMEKLANEQTLLASSSSLLPRNPFVPPQGFAEHIKQFYTNCTPYPISRSYFQGTLLGVKNENHMFFLMQERYSSIILQKRGIAPPGYYPLLQGKGKLPRAERLDFKIQEALKIAQQSGVERVSFAWNQKQIPLATALLEQNHTLLSRGKFSVGLHQPPLELIEVLVPKVPLP